MRLEDVKVGQKVIIKSKSVWGESIEEYLKYHTDISEFFKENGFLYVIEVGYESGNQNDFDCSLNEIISVGTLEQLEYCGGDFFLASDLELYDKPQVHVDMARQVFSQFKVLTQALESEQISEMFDHLTDATSNYIIEKLGLEREDFITNTVDNSLRDECTFDELLEELGVEVE